MVFYSWEHDGLRAVSYTHLDVYKRQDYMCNECGNCKSFCPYDSAPYLDKFTLFANEADMENSKNQGFVVLDRAVVSCKVRYLGTVSYTHLDVYKRQRWR